MITGDKYQDADPSDSKCRNCSLIEAVAQVNKSVFQSANCTEYTIGK